MRESGRPPTSAFRLPLSDNEVIARLNQLFRDWSARLYDDDPRSNLFKIVTFASEHYEHAELIVSQITRKVETNYVSKTADYRCKTAQVHSLWPSF